MFLEALGKLRFTGIGLQHAVDQKTAPMQGVVKTVKGFFQHRPDPLRTWRHAVQQAMQIRQMVLGIDVQRGQQHALLAAEAGIQAGGLGPGALHHGADGRVVAELPEAIHHILFEFCIVVQRWSSHGYAP